jgi:hypothetical protein
MIPKREMTHSQNVPAYVNCRLEWVILGRSLERKAHHMKPAILLFCCCFFAFGQSTSPISETKTQTPPNSSDQKPKDNDYGLGTRTLCCPTVDILSETGRVIGNDWVVRHDNRYFQVQAQSRQYAPAKGKVTVCEWEDGRLRIYYRGRAVAWEEIPGPVSAEAESPREAKKPKPPTPKADHPWRQEYRKMRPWSKPGQVPLLQEMSG